MHTIVERLLGLVFDHSPYQLVEVIKQSFWVVSYLSLINLDLEMILLQAMSDNITPDDTTTV